MTPVAQRTTGHDLGGLQAEPMQAVVKELFGIKDGPDLEALALLVATGDMRRMPVPIMDWELVEPGPNPIRWDMDEDRIT